MQTFKIALTIIIALFLQMLLPEHLRFFRYIDLPLLVTVYFSLQRAPFLAMTVGMVAGVGGDAIGGGILGVGGFSKILIGYLIAVTSIKFSLENPLVRLLVVAPASATNTILFAGLNLMLEQFLPNLDTWGAFGKNLAWKVLADTVTALFLFIALDRVFVEQSQARRMAIKRRFYD